MVTRGTRSMVIGPGGCRFSDSWRLGPLVCQALGPEEARDRLGANATGLAFNSLAAVERGPDGRTNPMVNAGAIATASLAPGASQGERWEFLRDGLWKTATATSACPSDFWTGGGWEPVYSDGSAARRWANTGACSSGSTAPCSCGLDPASVGGSASDNLIQARMGAGPDGRGRLPEPGLADGGLERLWAGVAAEVDEPEVDLR